jgi:hypothetical protein
MKLNRSECAVLPLVLKGWWFDMIASGKKREEYRDYKPYWKSRISNWVNHQKEGWDNISNNKWLVIGFSHGYKKPDMFFLLHRYEVREGAVHLEWGEPRAPHFVLVLGERVELEGGK